MLTTTTKHAVFVMLLLHETNIKKTITVLKIAIMSNEIILVIKLLSWKFFYINKY